MEVMKGEPSNLEAALNCATKIEAHEQSLITQGTLSKSSVYTSVSEEDRPRRRSRAVNAVQGTDGDSAVQLHVDESLSLWLSIVDVSVGLWTHGPALQYPTRWLSAVA